MLVATAVCPHPPLIVPELAGAAAPELDGLRAASAAAIAALAGARPDRLLVVGGADLGATFGPEAAAGFAPWGVDVRVGEGEPVLPLSLAVGRWLLERAGVAADGFHAVPFDAPPEECLALGRRLAAAGERVALLVMGDGSACLTERSPGYVDPRARPYHAMVTRALAGPDVAALAALDPAQAEELWMAGRAAFQVLAGAAGADADFTAEISYDEAPYGVGYLVATWRRADAG